MTTLRTLSFAAAVLLAGVAQADSSLLSQQQVSKIAGMMFQSYRDGNVNQMFADEMTCWDDASKTKRAEKKVVASCATAAMAGTFIEASYARSQRRAPNPRYAGEAVRERMVELSGLSNDDLKAVWETTLEPNVPIIIMGLQGAGMR